MFFYHEINSSSRHISILFLDPNTPLYLEIPEQKKHDNITYAFYLVKFIVSTQPLLFM